MDNFLFLNISAPSKLMCVCVYCDEEERADFFDSEGKKWKIKYPHCQRFLGMKKEINAIERFNVPINFSFLLPLIHSL